MTPKILFADDDPLMRLLYQPHLEAAGFEVIPAGNGREAVEAASHENPRLAVMDILMPEVDGLSAILELKRAAATRGIPIIAISADPMLYGHKARFADAGADVFLTKPFSPARLLQTIRQVLSTPATAS